MGNYILAFDQGTTSSRAILFDKKGDIKALAQKEFTQYFPQPGWVEHDPKEIWSTQMGVAAEAISKAGIKVGDIAAIGITNQRETTVVWDRTTGEPVYNAIVWQDRRTADFCTQMKNTGLDGPIQQRTGLIIDAYFSASKLKWILDNVKGAREKADRGDLCFGTVDSWLLWKLTDGKVHATDVSNASRTMLFNITNLEWDPVLLEYFKIPTSILPEVRSSSEIFGYTHANLAAANIPIAGICGDQQSALFGQMCLEPGLVKNTYGTGCFALMNTGDKIVKSENKLLSTIAWKIGDKVQYALEGSVFIGGAVVQWLRDGLGVIRNSEEVEALAEKVESTDGVCFVPAFAGLGAPYWSQETRGTIIGITRGTNTAHIARAALESIAFQTKDLIEAMQKDAGIEIKEIRVDGGATANNLLLQFQSDILNTKIIKPFTTETTALGVAYLAGLAVGFWKNVDEIQSQWKVEKVYESKMSDAERQQKYKIWKKAIKAALSANL
jgi:glycerol kinase